MITGGGFTFIFDNGGVVLPGGRYYVNVQYDRDGDNDTTEASVDYECTRLITLDGDKTVAMNADDFAVIAPLD